MRSYIIQCPSTVMLNRKFNSNETLTLSEIVNNMSLLSIFSSDKDHLYTSDPTILRYGPLWFLFILSSPILCCVHLGSSQTVFRVIMPVTTQCIVNTYGFIKVTKHTKVTSFVLLSTHNNSSVSRLVCVLCKYSASKSVLQSSSLIVKEL